MRRVAGSILVLILLTSVELAGAQKRLGGEFQVNTYTTSSQSGPSVAMDGAGNFVVVWQSSGQDGSSGGVFGQRFQFGELSIFKAEPEAPRSGPAAAERRRAPTVFISGGD